MGKKEGGRTLNPADKLRKEQRIKEQKKNAERRAATRAAIVAQKTEDELRSQLVSLRKAEAEGRADGKQLQIKKQIEERLSTLEKEAAEQLAAPKSLEEQYPDAEGSIYYHPIDNPYGVPPPGCFPMFKPGYIPKAQRAFLPLDHPLHPSYQPPALAPLSNSAISEDHKDQMDVDKDLPDLAELDEFADELDGVPPPPEEPDSDGDMPPPAPPTTEDDLPNIVYDDNTLDSDSDDPTAYFTLDDDDNDEDHNGHARGGTESQSISSNDKERQFDSEMRAPPPKRSGPHSHLSQPSHSGRSNHSASHIPHGPGQMPLGPTNGPFPFPAPGMPPFPFPPPGMPPFAPGPPPHAPPFSHRGHVGERGGGRGGGRGGFNNRSRRDASTDASGIPDPLDLGPLKKEGRDAASTAARDAQRQTTPSSSTAATSSQSPSMNVSPTNNDSDHTSAMHPMLIPSALRMKRKTPAESRPVAPRAAVVQSSSSSTTAQPPQSQSSGGSYEQFMADIKQLGAL